MKLFYQSIIILLCCLLTFSVFAQRKETIEKQNDASIYVGYIVMANHNDTVYGEIYFQNPVYNEQTLIFYKNGEKFIFHPEDRIISEYGFRYEKYNNTIESIEYQWFTYIRKLVPKLTNSTNFKEAFVERQIDNKICLYNYYELKTTKINSRKFIHNYFIEKKGVEGFRIIAITRKNWMEMITEYLIFGDNDIEASCLDYTSVVSLVMIQNAWLSCNSDYNILINESKSISTTDDTQ
jgi:hypothetical protein